VFLIGFDCVVPEKSRLKLCVCNTHLCLDNIRSFWTLGGRMSDPTTMKGLAKLYLPVQGKSDDFVADALTDFFKYPFLNAFPAE
jgi:hypothetical protein